MQEVAAPPPRPPLGIVFDSDIGNRPDSLLALALLYGLDGRGDVRTVVVTTSKPNLKSAALCDALGRFYAAGGFSRNLPVGMPEEGKGGEDTPMLAVVDKHPHGIHKLTDTAIVAAVLRNAFTAQHDGNCAVVLAGPATNLAAVLALNGAREWIERKVKVLVIADHLQGDVLSAQKVLAEWPGAVVLVGQDVGSAVQYPATSITTDYAWSQAHPVVDAYKTHKPMPYDTPTTEMAAVLYAARPQEGYFKVSEGGTLSMGDAGEVKFTSSANGKHRRLVSDPAQKERLLKIYTEVASAKPVPRMRFRPPVVEEKKPEVPAADKKSP